MLDDSKMKTLREACKIYGAISLLFERSKAATLTGGQEE